MFREALREAQGTKSLTQFANELGIDPSTLSNIYSGRRDPGRKVITALLNHSATREVTLSFLSKNFTSEKINLQSQSKEEHGS